MNSASRQALRGVGLGRIAVGLVTLRLAGRGAVPFYGSLPAKARAALRVLAARDVVQGASLVFAPDDRVAGLARAGRTVDALHAASMVPVVAFAARLRPSAAVSAASALTWIGLTVLASRRAPEERASSAWTARA